jgi:hypothetical protein
MNLHQCHLQNQSHPTTEYDVDTASVIAQNVVTFNNLLANEEESCVQTYSLHFGQRG